ncbi:MAG: sodium-dependent transporter, partial [Pseudomonadota bacterium]
VLLDFVDQLTANILLPLGGFLTAIFAGWVVSGTAAREELNFKSERSFKIWRFLCRWVSPVFVGLVLVYAAVIAPLIG